MPIQSLKNQVVIRVAESNDLPEIFRLVDSYEVSEVLGDVDKDLVKNNMREILCVRGIMLAEFNGAVIGGIAGYALPCMFTKDILFSCMFLYIKKEYRRLTKQFIKELELMLLTTHAKRLTFATLATPDGKKLERFFKGLGYTELETHFQKRF